MSAKSFVGSCCFWTELCVDPAPVQESCSRRAALPAAKCFQCTAEYLQSVWGSHFCVCCQVSPNVLPSTFNLSGESLAVKCLLMYCRVPSICLGESLLWLCFSRALISSAKSFVGACCFWTELCVVPAPVQESCSRRAALSAAKCFQCTAKYLQSVWGSHFYVCCQVSPNVLPSTFNLSGGVTPVSAAKCLLMYCRVPSICLGESLLCLCFSRALISSAKSFVGSCCFLD